MNKNIFYEKPILIIGVLFKNNYVLGLSVPSDPPDTEEPDPIDPDF